MSTTPQLDRIAEIGTWALPGSKRNIPSNKIVCADGTQLSVIGGFGAHCSPRIFDHKLADVAPDGGFASLEVGYPTVRPEPWEQWEEYAENPGDPTDSVYSYVPVELIRELINAHGGEKGAAQ